MRVVLFAFLTTARSVLCAEDGSSGTEASDGSRLFCRFLPDLMQAASIQTFECNYQISNTQ